VRLLFVKTSLAWPRASGHDVYTYFMMKACADLGHQVALATVSAPPAEALDGLRLACQFRLDGHSAGPTQPHATWLQRKYQSFWGISDAVLAALTTAVDEFRADAVIIVGLDALPYFLPLNGVRRIWFPADEWIRHHVSQLRALDRSTWFNVREAAIKGVYERAFTRIVDRTWVVSDSERRAMRWLAGMRAVDVVPLGVDSEHFRPDSVVPEARTAVFWGRLDFGPNIQALEWFAGRVWPSVRVEAPDARFTIIGFRPGREVSALSRIDGITVKPDVPDLRDAAKRHAAVVLPLVSGGGMKNKLLEAAALGMPIVCTTLATQGLQGLNEAPLLVADSAERFGQALVDLWRDPERGQQIGVRMRAWVVRHHDWKVSARAAIASLQPERRGAR
jgi:glycosyltransferase involved in cell wall biosynthesis